MSTLGDYYSTACTYFQLNFTLEMGYKAAIHEEHKHSHQAVGLTIKDFSQIRNRFHATQLDRWLQIQSQRQN
jgi:hypothetical protein